MKNTIICGITAGDEGKGKISDYLMQDHDICVRYSGSCNTGATVVVGSHRFKFHHVPVGIIQDKLCYIASQCLISPVRLMNEINIYKELGFDVDKKLKISPDCHIIKECHIEQDLAKEASNRTSVGSTKSGVSPCASDKYGRIGTKIGELAEFDKYFADVSAELNDAIRKDKSILFEGSQGTLLDIDHGFVYPYISTTSNVAAAACVSAGIGPTKITSVVGVFKAYMTKVGQGPFPTKIADQKTFDEIVEKGKEYGTTTGRKRDVGWLDIPLLKYACDINGVTSLAMTKFDVLSGISKYICKKYKSGKIPMFKNNIYSEEPILEQVRTDVTILEYAKIIEEEVGVKIEYLGTGPERNQIIWR